MGVLRGKARAPFDPRKFLAKVGNGKTISEYQKDQIVFLQGDPADAVFYIQKGKVKLTVTSEQGKEAVVGILGPGQFFGEGCLNGHSMRVTTGAAIVGCRITRIAKAAMIATMHDEPDFSQLFMAYLLTRNSRIEEDLIDQLFNSSEPSSSPCQFRQGRQAGADRRNVQSGDPRGDDRHNPIARELLHEQVPQIGLY
jgi:CRP/FNR family cyclic AMP-dependent transcriptional regulator